MADYHLSYEDDKALRKISWQWARATSTKDWELMKSICAPKVKLMYHTLSDSLQDEVKTVEEYVAQINTPERIGDAQLKLQHILGAVVFESTGKDTAQGDWQVHATHVRELSSGQKAEWIVGNYTTHFYERVYGKWMFAGLHPHTTVVERGKFSDVIGLFN